MTLNVMNYMMMQAPPSSKWWWSSPPPKWWCCKHHHDGDVISTTTTMWCNDTNNDVMAGKWCISNDAIMTMQWPPPEWWCNPDDGCHHIDGWWYKNDEALTSQHDDAMAANKRCNGHQFTRTECWTPCWSSMWKTMSSQEIMWQTPILLLIAQHHIQ